MRRFCVIILLTIWTLPLLAEEKTQVLPYSALMQSAKIYLGQKQKDFDAAKHRLQEAIDNYEDPVEAHFLMGIIHAERAQYKEMITHFRKFEEICAKAKANGDKKLQKRCEKDEMLKQIQDNIVAEWGENFQSGVTHLKQADSLTQEVAQVTDETKKAELKGLIERLLAAGEESFQSCLILDTVRYEAWTNLGLIEERRGDRNKAYELFERAYQLKPDDIGILSNLAGTAYQLEDYKMSAKYYGEIAAKDSSNALGALVNQAICYQYLKQDDDLIATIDKILQLEPNNPEIRHQRGMYYVQKAGSREIQDSAHVLDSLANARPNDKTLEKAQQALLDRQLGFYKQALPDLKIAAETQQSDADYWLWYGWSAFWMDDLQSARLAYEKCVELKPESDEAWCQLASVYAKLQLTSEFQKANDKCNKK